MSILGVAIQNMLAHEDRLIGDTTPVKPHIRAWQKQISDRIAFSRFMLSLELPLTHTAIPSLGSVVPSFTRATTETGQKYDEAGYLDFTALAGEIVFKGARRVRNLLTFTEDFSNAAWTKSGVSFGALVAAPDGTLTAQTVSGAGGYLTQGRGVSGVVHTASVYYKIGTATGVINALYMYNTVGGAAILLQLNLDTLEILPGNTGGSPLPTIAMETLDDGWLRLSLTGSVGGGTGNPVGIVTYTLSGTNFIWHPQLEDVTGQTTQTAGEYVSVGVESAPAYHGSMVDGVKCYDTDRDGALLPSAYTYDAVSLNGVVGTYVSTPDSVANSITGDFQFIAKVSAYAAAGLCGKDDGLTERSYALRSNGVGGTLSFFWWPTGASASETGATSTASTGIASGVDYWVKQTLDVDNGAGGWTVKFFTSTTDTDDPDSVVWSQVGADVTGAGVTSLFNSTTPLVFGAGISGQATHNGRIYSAQIYNGINGTLAVDFDASRYAGGTTLTGSTGETWTLNGSAVIHPTNYPIVGYVPWEARTNLILSSDDLANGTYWAASGVGVAAPALTTGQVDPSGTTKAVKLAFPAVSGAGNFSIFYASPGLPVAVTAAPHANAWYLKGEVGGEQVYIMGTPDGITYLQQLVTLTTEFQRFQLVGTPFAAGWYWQLGVDLRDGAQTAKGAQTIYASSPQLELGSFATPYIPTTTVAVARNADLLTYTGADVANTKTLAATFSRGVGVATTGVAVAITDGTTNNYLEAYLSSASTMRVAAASGGVAQGDLVTSNAYTPGQTSKIAATNSLNASKRDFDGVAQTEDTTYTPPTVTQINVGHVATLSVFNGPVNHIYGWTRNLSQSELGAVDV